MYDRGRTADFCNGDIPNMIVIPCITNICVIREKGLDIAVPENYYPGDDRHTSSFILEGALQRTLHKLA